MAIVYPMTAWTATPGIIMCGQLVPYFDITYNLPDRQGLQALFLSRGEGNGYKEKVGI